MRRASVNPISLLAAILLSILVAACGTATPEPTPTPLPEETSVPGTPEPTVPAEDENSQEEEAEPGATAELEGSQTPPATGLTAVIVSGETAGAGKPFSFDATQSQAGDVPIANYVWTMGDGTTLFGVSVQHAYSEPGFYTVTLIITDQEGQTDTTAKVVEVLDLEATATPTAEGEFVLDGTTWKLSNAMRGTTVTLAFGESTISGSAGCNTYNASYELTMFEAAKGSIAVGSISTSSNSCTSEIMAQERGYLESLASAGSITVEVNTLTMETKSGTLNFTLVETAEQATP